MRLSERLDLLTRNFVDALLAAVRATPLAELRPDLERQGRLATSPARSERGAKSPRPTARANRAGTKTQGNARRSTDRRGRVIDDEPKGEEVITNPEALLRAAFGDDERGGREPRREPRASALLSSSTTRESTAPAGAGTPAPASIESRIGRVIRRKRA